MDKINKTLIYKLNEDVDILKQLIKTTSVLSGFNAYSKLIPNQKILINTLGIQESKRSSEIENIITTNTEIFEGLVLSEIKGNTKEILNYNRAVNEGTLIVRKRLITRNLLEHIQSIVEPYKSGIRKIPVYLKNGKTGEVVYTPPKANEIKDLLDDLISFINSDFESNKENLLISAIVTHHQFESIHPFVDGNGRTGRILLILQLLYYGYIDEPILFVSRYINYTKAEYYKLLNGIHNGDDIENWKKFVMYYLKAIEVTSRQSIELIESINKLIIEVKKDLLELKFKRNVDRRLIDLMFEHPFFTTQKYVEMLEVNKKTALSDLEKMIEAKIIVKVSKGRNTYYKNIKLYELLENI